MLLLRNVVGDRPLHTENFQRHSELLAKLEKGGKIMIKLNFLVANHINVGKSPPTIIKPLSTAITYLWRAPGRHTLFLGATCGDISLRNDHFSATKVPRTRKWRRFGDQSPLEEALMGAKGHRAT